ncbi:MAG: sulfate transporter CysZ [Pseudomonadales bacterium]
MGGSFFTGIRHLLVGLKLLSKPGIRIFVLIPLAINVLLFALSIYILNHYFGLWMEQLLGWLPDWLSFIESVLWLIFAILVLVIVAFGFTVLANLIAAPFNGFLSEAVERYLSGQEPQQSARSLVAEISRSLWRELAKLRYYLPRVLGLVVLGFIPVINSVSPVLWALFGVWMMAIQYLDYPMDSNGVEFPAMRERLGQRRLTTLGFGSSVLLATLVPVLNWFVMPAAVAGATALWVREYKKV